MSDRRSRGRGRWVAILAAFVAVGVAAVFVHIEHERREVARLVAELADDDRDVATAAARRLEERGDPSVLPEMIAALAEGDRGALYESPYGEWASPEHPFSAALSLASRRLSDDTIARIAEVAGEATEAGFALAVHVLALQGRRAASTVPIVLERLPEVVAPLGPESRWEPRTLLHIVVTRFLQDVAFAGIERPPAISSDGWGRDPLLVIGVALAEPTERALVAADFVPGVLALREWGDASALPVPLAALAARVDEDDLQRLIVPLRSSLARMPGSFDSEALTEVGRGLERVIRSASIPEFARCVEALHEARRTGAAVPSSVALALIERAASLDGGGQRCVVEIAHDAWTAGAIDAATWATHGRPFLTSRMVSSDGSVADAAIASLLALAEPIPGLGDAALVRLRKTEPTAARIARLAQLGPGFSRDEAARIQVALREVCLSRGRPDVRLAALHHLSRAPEFVSDSLDALDAVLRDPSAEIRGAAALRLAEWERPLDVARDSLRELVSSGQFSVQLLAVLAAVGDEDLAASALGDAPSLPGSGDAPRVGLTGDGAGADAEQRRVEGLADRDRWTVLSRLAPSDRWSSHVAAWLHDDDADRFAMGASVLASWCRSHGSYRPNDAALAPLLERAEAGDPARRFAAWRQAADIGEAAQPAAPAIRRALSHRRFDVRIAAAESLLDIEGPTAAALPVYLEWLAADEEHSWRAALAVAELGLGSPEALDALRRAAASKRHRLASAAANALTDLAGGSGDAR